jgi:hypothetical protein
MVKCRKNSIFFYKTHIYNNNNINIYNIDISYWFNNNINNIYLKNKVFFFNLIQLNACYISPISDTLFYKFVHNFTTFNNNFNDLTQFKFNNIINIFSSVRKDYYIISFDWNKSFIVEQKFNFNIFITTFLLSLLILLKYYYDKNILFNKVIF